jgi:hypothetical protein
MTTPTDSPRAELVKELAFPAVALPEFREALS